MQAGERTAAMLACAARADCGGVVDFSTPGGLKLCRTNAFNSVVNTKLYKKPAVLSGGSVVMYTEEPGCPPMGTGRCGPAFYGYSCLKDIPYCNEASGWCGVTPAHRDAQPSTAYDYCQTSGTALHITTTMSGSLTSPCEGPCGTSTVVSHQ